MLYIHKAPNSQDTLNISDVDMNIQLFMKSFSLIHEILIQSRTDDTHPGPISPSQERQVKAIAAQQANQWAIVVTKYTCPCSSLIR